MVRTLHVADAIMQHVLFMRRHSMARSLVTVVLVVMVAGSALVVAQTSRTPSVHVSAADLLAVLKKAGELPVIDTNAQTVQAGPNQVMVNIARRTQMGMPTNAAVAHNSLSEIYYVTEGAGTLVTGGTLTSPTEEANNTGGNIRGAGIQNGESRRIAAGDVVVIPAGTPHTFSAIEGTLVYLNLRINPATR